MKIIIIPDYPGLRGRRYSIAESLANKGHEVYFLLWDVPYHMRGKSLLRHLLTSMKSDEYRYEAITVHKVSRLPYYWPYINGLFFKYQVKKLFKRINADIIFTEGCTNESEVPKELPFIYDLADDYAAPADIYGSVIYKLAFKLLDFKGSMRRQCQHALAVTVLSELLFDYAAQYNSKVYRLYDGVEAEPIRSVLSNNSTYPHNPHSIVYASGFGSWSRAIETMKTVKELKKEFPNIELTLLGDGILSSQIRQYIKDNDAESYIHFLGYIQDRKTYFEYLNRSEIGLNISDKNKWRDAAHPLKVMEYCALGKKVVSSNLAEVENLHFRNIFVFSDIKGSTFKEALRSALMNRDKKNEYADISRHVLKNYDWNKIVGDLMAIINEVKNERN